MAHGIDYLTTSQLADKFYEFLELPPSEDCTSASGSPKESEGKENNGSRIQLLVKKRFADKKIIRLEHC